MARRELSYGVLALALVLGGAGCSRTFRAAVTQPNPLVHPTETLRDSEQVAIITGDMELEKPQPTSTSARAAPSNMVRQPLENVASFTVVSRDRLRFHVQLEHKWQEWANPGNWNVYLIDDKGRRWEPESVEHAHTAMITQMWDQEQDSVVKDSYGDIVAINDDGYKRPTPLGSLSVFRGRADFVFYQRDLFTSDVKWLKLVVRRPGLGFEFRWNFDDHVVADSDE
jgi:hypothetical protein